MSTRESSAGATPLDPHNDAALVKRASRGDADAAGRLLQSVRSRALRHATRLGRKSGAQDTAQNVVLIVLRIHKSESATLNPATIGGLIATLTRRDWKDERRRRARHAAADLSALDPVGDLDPAESAERDETWAGVRAAVARLREDDRQLVELRYWEGLSLREIARRIRMSKTSVAQRLERVEAELRSDLREPNSDSGSVTRRPGAPPPSDVTTRDR